MHRAIETGRLEARARVRQRPPALSLIAALVWWAIVPSPASQQPPAATFRSPVVVVPVDVRVIDEKTQQPITDLKQEDFSVFENGVRQEVRLFLHQRFDGPADAPTPPGQGDTPAPVGAPLSFSAQPNRVFLFVLGTGRLQEPSKGLDAALDFVRTRLLPRDQVAVFAYNRATAFSADHERAAGVIERFREENDAIYSEMANALSGLAAVYGTRELPKSTQARVDRVFTGGGMLPAVRTGAAENAATADRQRNDTRNAQEAVVQSMIEAARLGPESTGGSAGTAGVDWSAFDQFAARTATTLQDTGNLYAAIAYMQRLPGEKHLVFVTEGGLRLRREEDEVDIARAAADSRVVIDVLQTGGVVSPLTARAQRSLSELTGGIASVSEYSRAGLARLDAATRSGYLLGYYPSNSKWDNAFRSITVQVNRPHATAIYRHGYNARVASPVFDRFEYATRFRMEGAAFYDKDVKDIGVTLTASLARAGGGTFVNVSARIDPAALHFDVRDGIHVGRITIAVVPMDSKNVMLGGTYKRQVARLEYDDDTLAFAAKVGIPYDARLAVPPDTRYIRIIVYDPAADLVGTAGVRVY
jgi:VWFA-related protein